MPTLYHRESQVVVDPPALFGGFKHVGTLDPAVSFNTRSTRV